MGVSTLILGTSGRGKSTSLRNLDPKKVILIKAVNKPLPFRSTEWKNWDFEKKEGTVIVTDDFEMISAVIEGAEARKKEIVIVDDMQYIMANEFMRRANEKGFDKFVAIAKHFWEIIMTANEKAGHNTRVYFMGHTDESDDGTIKAKTIGKMLEEKICVEGLFSIVLRAIKDDTGFWFSTQNSGKDTVKAPIGLFSEGKIDNDLKKVDDLIKEYYNIGEK